MYPFTLNVKWHPAAYTNANDVTALPAFSYRQATKYQRAARAYFYLFWNLGLSRETQWCFSIWYNI